MRLAAPPASGTAQDTARRALYLPRTFSRRPRGPAMPDLARSLRTLWAAITVGGLSALAILTVLSVTADTHAFPGRADDAFYLCALFSAAALGVAFWLISRIPARVGAAPSEAAAGASVRALGVAAMAAAEASAILAGAAVFITGNVLVAAFGAPFLAFAALTWPTDARVAARMGARP